MPTTHESNNNPDRLVVFFLMAVEQGPGGMEPPNYASISARGKLPPDFPKIRSLGAPGPER